MASVALEIIDYGATLDFQLRERYVSMVMASEEQLDVAFGKYTRPAIKSDWIACGLNGCDQPHRYGFVIRLRDGRETHCGPDCGEKHFGAKWAEVIATVRAAEEAAATRNAVAALLSEREAIVARGAALVAQSRRLEGLISGAKSHLPWSLVKAIEACAREGGSVRVAVEADGTSGGRSRGPQQLRTLAIIDGVALLTNSFTAYSKVIEASLPGLRELTAESLRGASQKDLARRSKEGQAFTATLDRAERQIAAGDRLFAPTNLQKLELLIEHKLRSDDITPRLRKSMDDLYAMVKPN